MACPVCDRPREDEVARCACGYDFAGTNATVALDRLRERRERNRKDRLTSALMLMPLLSAPGIVIGGSALTIALSIPGLIFFSAVGLTRSRRAAKEAREIDRQLAAATAIGMLPPARVVD